MLRTITGLGSAVLLCWSVGATSVEVNIQGRTLLPAADGGTCIDISGDYPGVRIEASEAGKTPLICYSDAKEDMLALRNVTFVATVAIPEAQLSGKEPLAGQKDQAANPKPSGTDSGKILIEFQHTFPPGPNGRVMARFKIQGFFATENGVDVATGDKIRYVGVFSQGGKDDPITNPFDHEVTKELDSALFQYKGKKHYLISGPRTLKARLEFSFAGPGHKLTLLKGASVSIDTGSRFEDKLEEMETEELIPQQGQGGEGSEGAELDEEFSF